MGQGPRQGVRLSEIIDAIPSLSPDEIKQVIARCLLEQQGAPKAPAATLTFYTAFAAEMQAAGQPVYKVGTFNRHARFKEGAAATVAFVRTHIKPVNRLEEQAILRYLVQVLLRDLERRGKPQDQSYVAACVGRIPGLVETQFPGYRRAGLLPKIIRRAL